jgi:NAD(P)-dependent dehydrogenase (short-subunit alcohol dehydrogenase family)
MNVNSVGPLRVARAFLPLLQAGDRRICFVSSEAGSIAMCNRDAFSGYCMSKTALNMASASFITSWMARDSVSALPSRLAAELYVREKEHEGHGSAGKLRGSSRQAVH